MPASCLPARVSARASAAARTTCRSRMRASKRPARRARRSRSRAPRPDVRAWPPRRRRRRAAASRGPGVLPRRAPRGRCACACRSHAAARRSGRQARRSGSGSLSQLGVACEQAAPDRACHTGGVEVPSKCLRDDEHGSRAHSRSSLHDAPQRRARHDRAVRPGAARLEPLQALLPGGRLHQARPRELLHRVRAGRRAPPARAPHRDEALGGRRAGQAVLSEARARRRARVAGDRRRDVPQRTPRARAGAQRRRAPGVGREPRRDRLEPLAGAPRRSRPPRRAARGPRPAAGHPLRAGARGDALCG